jgi:O-antigen/teichoic acid export membrane protein
MNNNSSMMKIWQIVSKLCFSPRTAFVVIRYATTAAVVIEMLLFARLLGPKGFGSYALALQLVGFLALVGSGCGAGYVLNFYKQENRLADVEYLYIFGSLVQYIGGGIAVLILAWFSGSYLQISSLLLLIQVPYYITEPILRVRNKFVLPAIGRASGSIATILLTFIILIFQTKGNITDYHLDLQTGITLMISGNILGYGVYYLVLMTGKQIDLSWRKLWITCCERGNLQRYLKQMIQPSWIYTISSIIFTAFTYVDRLFLEKYYPKSTLSAYALAWQVAQGVLLLLTALNTISGIRIGESQSEDPISLIKVANRQLKISGIAGGFSLVLAVAVSWVLSLSLYRDYDGLLVVTMLLSLGYLGYGIIGSVMMLLFFENKFRQVTVAYLLILLGAIFGHIIAHNYGLSFLYPIAFSSLLLVMVNIWLWTMFRKVGKQLLSTTIQQS